MMKNQLLLVLVVFLTVSTADSYNVTQAGDSMSVIRPAPPLTDQDFTLQVGKQSLYLGQDWDSLQDWQGKMIKANKTGRAEYTLFPVDRFRDGYVGDLFIETDTGTSYYKIFSNHYENDTFEILTSNLYYDKPPKRDFNTYVISQISVYSSTYSTSRKITTGMNIEQLVKAYGKGEAYKASHRDWIKYSKGNKLLVFEITGRKIDDIVITYPETFDWMISQAVEPLTE